MATSSEVKAALDDISQSIRTERQSLKNAKARIATAQNNLNSIPTVFSDALATIGAYTPVGDFESLAQDELSKMTTEFIALRNDAALAVTDLGNRTEF
jgi:hypothetical protein